MSYYHLCCKGNHDHAPEKIRNLMLDEPSICDEIRRLWNIYYQFSWLDTTRKHLVFIPDGETKAIIMPALDISLFREVIDTFNQKNSLISKSKPLSYSYFPNAEIVCLTDSYIVRNEWMPFVQINCFLKHLSALVKILVENGLILKSHEQWNILYRANIHDRMDTQGTIIYTGDPGQWYNQFMIHRWEEQK